LRKPREIWRVECPEQTQCVEGHLNKIDKEITKKMWCVYILKCSDGSYYIGHTNNIQERITRHNAGQAAKWTASRLPARLAYRETYQTERQAVKRELQIKKWSHQKKKSLITGDLKTLKILSKSRN
jgi:tRNA/rRNA methyltransferase